MSFSGTSELKTLEDRLLDLEMKFIEPHSNPMESVDKYLLDLQSYAILCHAAFEEYVERICIKVAETGFEQFKDKNSFSFTTICMLHFIEGHDSLNNWDSSDKIFDKLLTRLGNVLTKIKKKAEENNGMNINYLKHLLIPVGLEIPHTTKEIGALEQLAKFRGDFAHRSTTGLSVIPTPVDVVHVVEDVLAYMNDLDKEARTIKYFKL